MTKIGLVGLPGSGKTVLAQTLENAYIMGDGQCAECNTPVAIVDKYAEDVAWRGDWAIGLEGGWLANAAIALERYNRERRAAMSAKTIISCGTVIESAVYLAMEFEHQQTFSVEAEQFAVAARIEAGLRFFSALAVDTLHYDRMFYLPPVLTPDNERWKVFDRNVQAAFGAFEVPIEPLVVEEFSDAEDLVAQRVALCLAPKDVNEPATA